jgi:hypothetical protein
MPSFGQNQKLARNKVGRKGLGCISSSKKFCIAINIAFIACVIAQV